MSDGTLPEVDSVEAIALVAGGAYLLDVREPNEWDELHTSAAVLLPMSVIQERVDEVPVDRTVYVVCHSGARSARVAAFLRSEGVDAVNVTGGMVAWEAAGGEIVASAAT